MSVPPNRIFYYIGRFLDFINKSEVLLFLFFMMSLGYFSLHLVAPEKAIITNTALSTIPQGLQFVIFMLVLELVADATLNQMERAGAPRKVIWKLYAKWRLTVWLLLLGWIVRDTLII